MLASIFFFFFRTSGAELTKIYLCFFFVVSFVKLCQEEESCKCGFPEPNLSDCVYLSQGTVDMHVCSFIYAVFPMGFIIHYCGTEKF